MNTVVLIRAGIPGVDDIGDVSLPQGVGDFLAALADLAEHMGADPVFFQILGGAGGSFDVEAQVVEAADQLQSFLLILVGDGCQNCAVVLQMHTGGLQRLIQSAIQCLVVADGFAGRLHFG